MKFTVEINKKTVAEISKKQVEKIIKTTIELGAVNLPATLDISVAFVSRGEIKKINKIYRKRDEVTDILSFSDYSGNDKKKIEDNKIFCELVVCYPYIKTTRVNDKKSIKKEVACILSHGMLHCLDFRHGKKMYAIQDSVAEKF